MLVKSLVFKMIGCWAIDCPPPVNIRHVSLTCLIRDYMLLPPSAPVLAPVKPVTPVPAPVKPAAPVSAPVPAAPVSAPVKGKMMMALRYAN
jgi:hypothetical protein